MSSDQTPNRSTPPSGGESAHAGTGAAAGATGPQRVSRQTIRRRRLVVGAIGALVLALVLALVGPRVMRALNGPQDFEGEGSGSVTVVVESGQTGSQIAQTLYSVGVVASPEAFVQALANNSGAEVQPGTYTMHEHMSAAQALELMRSGGRTVNRVTVREGLWQKEVFAVLSQGTGTAVSEYEAVAKAAKTNPALLGLPSSANGAVEGYLFPATYDFDPGTSATAQLKQMVSHADAELTRLGVSDSDAERIIIIASLIEAEARNDEDRPKVSRVIYNRLAEPMRLQMDSTVNYGVQKRSITTTDAERAHDNPYNTYFHDGLPAGPVGNPGASAIQAAKNPAAGPWLYFVTVNPTTGETVFSTTKADHDKAVLQFQAWCRDNPGNC